MKNILIAAAIALTAVPVQASPLPLGYQYFCAQNPVECSRSGDSSIQLEAWQPTLERVNRRVNRAIAPRTDSDDTWRLNPRAGDCEDYAITKRAALAREGVPRNAMRIGIYRRGDGVNHAVLLVTTDRGVVVLDNLTGAIRTANREMRTF